MSAISFHFFKNGHPIQRNDIEIISNGKRYRMDAPRNEVQSKEPIFHDEAGAQHWEPAAPKEAGLDEALLLQAHEQIQAAYPKMLCFLVVKDGKLVFEQYYGGADASAPMDLRSGTKSITAATVALAAADGAFPGLLESSGQDEGGPTVETLFESELPRTASQELRTTTMRHLLTMTSGLHWKTGKRLGELYIPRLHRSRHWVRFALRLPVNPDTRGAFQYRSMDSHLLSAAVTAVTGQTAASIAQDRLFAPLGIAAPRWETDPQGVSAGHIGLALTGRDLAKLGWLHAAGGVWQGRRLLPHAYVRQALTPHSEGLPAFGRYGWQWWIARAHTGDTVRCALGHGGQLLFVVPERRLVTVFTANPKVSRWKHPLRLLERYVLPACPQP
jgi:CubicO group peptidase (beta-lactamase class C family)